MLTVGADMLAGQGFDNASTAVASEVSAGGSAKTKVRSGSYVDVKGWKMKSGKCMDLDLVATGRIVKQQGLGFNMSINFKF